MISPTDLPADSTQDSQLITPVDFRDKDSSKEEGTADEQVSESEEPKSPEFDPDSPYINNK